MNKADFVAGQVSAHLVLLRALIATHPQRELLQEQFELRAQVALSASVPSGVSEDYLSGFHQEVQSLFL